jgi:hypothetical protein
MIDFRCTFFDATRAGAGAVAAIDAVVQDVVQQAEIGDVGLGRAAFWQRCGLGAHFRANMG